MKLGIFCVLLAVLTGCSEQDPFKYDLSDAKRIDVNLIISAFKNGSIACNQYDAITHSCIRVQELDKVTSDGVVVVALTGVPFSHKIMIPTRLTQRNNLLCTNQRENYKTMVGFKTMDERAEISEFDKMASLKKQKEVRSVFLDLIEDEEYCWAYYKANNPSNGLEYEILMVTYINGVRQRVRPGRNRINFFNVKGNGSNLKLRKNSNS